MSSRRRSARTWIAMAGRCGQRPGGAATGTPATWPGERQVTVSTHRVTVSEQMRAWWSLPWVGELQASGESPGERRKVAGVSIAAAGRDQVDVGEAERQLQQAEHDT